MRIGRRRGRVQLRLDPPERELLGELLDELDTLLAADPARPEPGDAEVVRRLFPSAYPDDERASAEFREITENSLRDDRRERLAACRAELVDDDNVALDAEAGDRWLRVLNDLRLTLGTRLGVTEDTDGPDIDPTEPEAQPWIAYGWLTMLQDELVRRLPD